MHTPNATEIRAKSGENDRCFGAKMICCRWKMRSWIYCTLSALPVISGKAFQPVMPSNHKVRKFWVTITPYFLGQGINYRTVANQFSVPVPTVCRIVHKETKPIANNLLFEKMLTSVFFRGSRLIISVKYVVSPVSFVDSLAKNYFFHSI